MIKYSTEVIEKVNQISVLDYISKYLDVKKKSNLYIAKCPFHTGDRNPSLHIYTDTNSWYCFGCGKGGSLTDYVMYQYKYSFPKAVEYLIKYINLDISQIKPDIEINSVLRKFNSKNKLEQINYLELPNQIQNEYKQVSIQKYFKDINDYIKHIEGKSHIKLPSDIMNNFKSGKIKEWIKEGISQNVLDKYQVKYDTNSNRIVFPVFNNDGDIVSIKGRTLYSNYNDLGIKKYQHYIKIGTTDFLYGYKENKEYIQKQKEVILFESEKSVMKLETWGINNSLAVETHSINDYQIRQILNLHCNVVIAFDKDVKLNTIKNKCKQLKAFTNVYVIIDKNNILSDKDAPVDKGLENWQTLYNQKFKI